MKPIDPRFVPKLARQLAKWQRTYGTIVWATKGMKGTKFFAPPSMPPLVHEVGGLMLDQSTGIATKLPADATMDSYRALTEYYSETLEKAKTFYLTDKITNLALRTQMPKYKLTLDMLRIGPDNSFVPWGFIHWGMPIGQAERHATENRMLDLRTGEIESSALADFSPFEDADFPVVAASWRYEPEANSIWVAFYTQHDEHLRIRAEAGDTPAQLDRWKKTMEPLALEREQEFPLDQTLNWCDADPADGPRLAMTARMDPSESREEIRDTVIRNNALAEEFVSDWVRVLVSSWMLMRWKIAEREVVPPTQDVIRKVAKETGHSKESVARDHGCTVVRLDAPIRKQGPKPAGTKKGAWTVRVLVGPVVRERQYIPAWDTYDEEPRLIEPFWMGPADAPISNPDKVFVIGES